MSKLEKNAPAELILSGDNHHGDGDSKRLNELLNEKHDTSFIFKNSYRVASDLWKYSALLHNGNIAKDIYIFSEGGYRAASGAKHYLVLLKNKILFGWGKNDFGQITSGEQNIPVPKRIMSNVVDVAAGDFHSLALLANGTVLSWGKNNCGQLGIGNFKTGTIPEIVSLPRPAKRVFASANYSLALLENNELWCWGGNERHCFGDMRFEITGEFVSPRLDPSCSSLPVLLGESVTCVSATKTMLAFLSGKTVFIYGDISFAHKNRNVEGKFSWQGEVGDDVRSIATSAFDLFILFNDGTLKKSFYGEDCRRQDFISAQSTVIADHVREITSCSFGMLAVMEDDSVTSYSIGYGKHLYPGIAEYDVGDDFRDSNKSGLMFHHSAENVAYVYCSNSASFLMNKDGSVFVRGEDALSYFLDDIAKDGTPIKLLEGCEQIVFGELHTLALDENKVVWAWGDNSFGQSGFGSCPMIYRPVAVEGLKRIKKIDADCYTSYVLDEDGDLWVWGFISKKLFDVEVSYCTAKPQLLYSGVADFQRSGCRYGSYEKCFYLRLNSGKYILIGEGITRYLSHNYNIWKNRPPFEVPNELAAKSLKSIRSGSHGIALIYDDIIKGIYTTGDNGIELFDSGDENYHFTISDLIADPFHEGNDAQNMEGGISELHGNIVFRNGGKISKKQLEEFEKKGFRPDDNNNIILVEDASIWHKDPHSQMILKGSKLYRLVTVDSKDRLEFNRYHIDWDILDPCEIELVPLRVGVDIVKASYEDMNFKCDSSGESRYLLDGHNTLWAIDPRGRYGYFPYRQPLMEWEKHLIISGHDGTGTDIFSTENIKFKKMSSTNYTVTAIDEDGCLWAWGNNFDNKFADNSLYSSKRPVPVRWGVRDYISLYDYTLILFNDGSVKEYGHIVRVGYGISSREIFSQGRVSHIFIGFDTDKISYNPGDVDPPGVPYFFALLKSGELFKWQRVNPAAAEYSYQYDKFMTETGELKDYFTEDRLKSAKETAERLRNTSFDEVLCCSSIRDVEFKDKKIEFIGKDNKVVHVISPLSIVIDEELSRNYRIDSGNLYYSSKGYSDYFLDWEYIGDGTKCPKASDVFIMSDVVQINSIYDPHRGQAFSAALKGNGGIYTWGSNKYGVLGTGDTKDRLHPCCITNFKESKKIRMLYGLGHNNGGQLGPAGRDFYHYDDPVPLLKNISAVSSHGGRSVALDIDGKLWCWGVGINRLPQIIEWDNKVKYINSVNARKWLFVDETGCLFEIRMDYEDEDRMDDERLILSIPTPVCDLKNVRVAAESENALLVVLEGNILFVRDKGADSFKKVLPDVEKVYARFGLNVAVQRDGLVWVWGDYADRRTSRSKKFRQEKPRLVMENGKSVAVDGNGNIYAATKKGTLWRLCPKDGYEYGELETDILHEDVIDVACGSSHGLIIKNDHTLWQFGSDEHDSPGKQNGEIDFHYICDRALTASAGESFSLVVRNDEVTDYE